MQNILNKTVTKMNKKIFAVAILGILAVLNFSNLPISAELTTNHMDDDELSLFDNSMIKFGFDNVSVLGNARYITYFGVTEIFVPIFKHEALEGATITLENDSFSVQTLSDSKGNFRFEDINPGKYEIWISKEGYQRPSDKECLGPNIQWKTEVKINSSAEDEEIYVRLSLKDKKTVYDPNPHVFSFSLVLGYFCYSIREALGLEFFIGPFSEEYDFLYWW